MHDMLLLLQSTIKTTRSPQFLLEEKKLEKSTNEMKLIKIKQTKNTTVTLTSLQPATHPSPQLFHPNPPLSIPTTHPTKPGYGTGTDRLHRLFSLLSLRKVQEWRGVTWPLHSLTPTKTTDRLHSMLPPTKKHVCR